MMVAGCVLLVSFSAPTVARAQDTTTTATTDTAAMNAVVTRARSMVERGASDSARTLLDSLVNAQEPASDARADALFWRAALRESVSEAEYDWKRIVVESPLSPRVPEALLRLAELALARGHPADARSNLEALLRADAPEPQQRQARLWIVRTYFDERDNTRACAASTALRGVPFPEGEMRLQADEFNNRCAIIAASAAAAANVAVADTAKVVDTATAKPPAATPTAPTTPTPSAARARYAVQVAAYNTRAEATAAVARLKKAGHTARVEGSRKPFRVQVGRYTTRAEATKALSSLKARGYRGAFIADLP